MVERDQQHYILFRNQRSNPEVSKLVTVLSLTTSRDPVHEHHEQDQWHQLWQSPTRTVNEFDLLPNMQAQLLLWFNNMVLHVTACHRPSCGAVLVDMPRHSAPPKVNLVHPLGLTSETLFNYIGYLWQRDEVIFHQVLRFCQIKEILKLFLPALNSITCVGQQYSTQIKNNLGRALVFLSEPPNS